MSATMRSNGNAAVGTAASRPTKKRESGLAGTWQPEEVEALEAGVRKYGEGHWKEILEDSSFSEPLRKRTNTDLKDKWRIIKKHRDSKAERDPRGTEEHRQQQDAGSLASPSNGSDVSSRTWWRRTPRVVKDPAPLLRENPDLLMKKTLAALQELYGKVFGYTVKLKDKETYVKRLREAWDSLHPKSSSERKENGMSQNGGCVMSVPGPFQGLGGPGNPYAFFPGMYMPPTLNFSPQHIMAQQAAMQAALQQAATQQMMQHMASQQAMAQQAAAAYYQAASAVGSAQPMVGSNSYPSSQGHCPWVFSREEKNSSPPPMHTFNPGGSSAFAKPPVANAVGSEEGKKRKRVEVQEIPEGALPASDDSSGNVAPPPNEKKAAL